MMSHSAAALIALATIANATGLSATELSATGAGATGAEVGSLSHDRLATGQKFEIQTADRVYRGEMVDRSTGQCQLASSTDGTTFTPARTVYLLGATAGRQARQMLVVMHAVKIGQKMELGLGDLEQKNRHVTAEVQGIRVWD